MLALVERRIKRRWHDELVAHPSTHAWVLNLYRAGEHHPATVENYFPVERAPAWLAPKLAKHRDEEARHDRIYAAAVTKMGEELVDFTGLDVFNVAIREHTAVGAFDIRGDDDDNEVARKLAHFLAHAHFLEARIARSLEFHIDACERAGKDDVARAVQIVLDDENEHARYTRESVFELVPRDDARAILEVHRAGEARANLAFSARQVRAHIARSLSTAPASTTAPGANAGLWRLCAFIMEEAVAHG